MTRTVLRPLAAGAAVALLLAGCGTDDPAPTAAGIQPSPRAGGAPMVRMPGTFGQIAAVDGNVLQVRNPMSGQTAVTVTDSTTVTDQVAGTLADVTTGACVAVRSAGTGTASDQVTAASVAVTATTADGCAGPGGGERPSDLPSAPPTDRPSGMPGGLALAGEVTSVSDTGFVVQAMGGEVTVTVAGDTTYTHAVAADASALTRGRCVRVQGDADDAGAVTATAIQVSDAVDDQCAP